MNLAFKLSELWKLKVSRMDVCNLTSLSPDGIKACRAIYIEELVQITMRAFGQLKDQTAVPSSLNVDD